LYPDDLAKLDELIADGYADNRSEAIRRSIGETWKWTIEAKR
jgi:Arc/MetJ-type ribon-helix-helix transcriptional regulator